MTPAVDVAKAGPRARRATILVVDDNQVMRKMVRLTLESEGHRVCEAADGATALRLMVESAPDLVLQDLLLPDMDGFELLVKLRETPGGSGVPVLAFSGFLSKLEQSRSMQAGFTDHLFKPVEPARLIQIVAAHLPVPPADLLSATGPRVLAADDDTVQLKLLQIHLERLGYQVDVARDGLSALAQAKAHPPDAILSDVLMPGLDGFRLCLAIRQEPALAGVPLILMSSAYTEADDRELAKAAGANDLVLRTPGLEEVTTALADNLASHAAPAPEAGPELPLEDYTHRVIRQLERQVGLNFNLSRRLSMLEARFSVLASLAKSLNDTSALDSVLDEMLSGALDAFAISKGLAYMLKPDGSLELRGQLGFPESWAESRLSNFFGYESLLKTLMEDGRPMALVQGQLAFAELQKVLDQVGAQGMIIAPVVLFEEVVGVLVTASEHTELGNDWISFAQALGAQVGQAVGLARALSRLKASEERYRTIVETANEAIILVDDQDRLSFVNGRTAEMFGYEVDELLGRPIFDFMDGDSLQAAIRRFARRREGARETYEARFRRKDGSDLWLQASASPVFDDEGCYSGALALHTNITDRKRAEEALAHSTLHDQLTGLPNRVLLHELLHQAILSARRDQRGLALLMMDLDRFKEINDAFGHHFGDMVLKELGRRLRVMLRESDTLARLGGDEFAAILPASGHDTDAIQAANKVLDVVNEPLMLEGRTVQLGASVGIVQFPDHGEDPETLVRRADVAMYAAKGQRGGYAIYSPEQDQNTATRVLLTSELRRGIEQNELRLYYQPKVDFKTGRLKAVEALVRWQHSKRGFMAPDSFIPLAEQTGLIEPMTRWVMDEGLRQCRAWKDQGLQIPVAINQSMRNLYDRELPEHMAEQLASYGLEPADLTIEITESMIMADPTRAMEVVSGLADLGIALSIDDFGTGYSSLAYLKRLPVSEIKVDKSFVLDMVDDENDAAIVRSTIDLAHNLGLTVVAEGVETEPMWKALADLGCDVAQGYFLAKPLPAEGLERWLEARAVAVS